ncbi:hypothetical protein [Neobacillus jeddahensis]|uniref:hypothetical protein n=1 Tax=Neobacillus jeddahensis TaxID=1461580 RepID=UPI0005AB06C6|nr:hypothetical protein [Neobacillus jeddahensis]
MKDVLYFLLYALIGGIAGAIFKWVAALLEGIFIGGISGLLTGFKSTIAERMEYYPKRFFFILLLKNVIVGSINALMIYIITFNFMFQFDGNYWVYVIASIFWSFLLLGYTPSFVGMYFMTSTVSLILMWVGFSILAPLIIAPITFIISLAYYYGRINVILEEEQMRHNFQG